MSSLGHRRGLQQMLSFLLDVINLIVFDVIIAGLKQILRSTKLVFKSIRKH